MWFYIVLCIGCSLGSAVERQSQEVFLERSSCEAAAIGWAKAAHAADGQDYGYICKFDAGAEKDYQPRKLPE